MRRLKNWLKTYLDYTSGQESPEVYHYWSGVSVIAATLCRSVWADLDYFVFYPNMYLVLVGPSGVGKSTASDIAVDNIYRSAFPQYMITKGKITLAKLIEDMGEQFLLHGVSRAFVYAPEFKVFTQALSSNTSMIEDLTDLYACPKDWDYRTKNRGVVTLQRTCINVLGASVPEWLCTNQGGEFINTGFSARILYIGAIESDRCFHKPQFPLGADQMKLDLVHDLQEMALLKGPYHTDKAADHLHKIWYQKTKNTQSINDAPEKLRGYIGRKDGHMLKLAMCQKASTSDSMILTEKDLQLAIDTLEGIEKGMMVAYQALAYSSMEVAVRKIIDLLRKSREGFLTHREIMRKSIGIKGFGPNGIDEILNYMVRCDILTTDNTTRKNQVIYSLKLVDFEGDNHGKTRETVDQERKNTFEDLVCEGEQDSKGDSLSTP